MEMCYLQVHIWAGISKHGATPMAIFTGIMNIIGYQNILQDHLIPFLAETGPTTRFMQDNDPKHVSRSTRQWLIDHQVNWFPTPPESPDLNPIELVWHELKSNIRRTKPANKAELVQTIAAFWQNITPERCTKYIDHLQTVMPVVVEKLGEPSGY